MNLNSDQRKLLDQFVKQELLICELYKLFSKRYPDYTDFWTAMAIEEKQHAFLLKRMADTDTDNRIFFSNGELRSTSLDSSIRNLRKIIEEFEDDAQVVLERQRDVFPKIGSVVLIRHRQLTGGQLLAWRNPM